MSAPFCSKRTTSSLSLAAHAARNTQSAENLILRATWRGCAGSRFVSDCSQRFSCSARLNRAELERVSRDIAPATAATATAAAAGDGKKHDAFAALVRALGRASPSLDGADGAAPAASTARSYNHFACRAHRLLSFFSLGAHARPRTHAKARDDAPRRRTRSLAHSLTCSLARPSLSLTFQLSYLSLFSLLFAVSAPFVSCTSFFTCTRRRRRLHYTHAQRTYTCTLAFTSRDSARETGVSRESAPYMSEQPRARPYLRPEMLSPITSSFALTDYRRERSYGRSPSTPSPPGTHLRNG